MNVYSLFEKAAQAHGPKVALRQLESGREWTFHELYEALGKVQAGLDAAGVSAQERVALLGSADARYLLCDYGVMAADRVRVPLDPSLRCDEQAAQLQDAGVRLLIHGPEHAGRALEIARAVPGLALSSQSALLDRICTPQTGRIGPGADRLASLSYTGGTTASPKAVMVTHGGLSAAVQNIIGVRDMGPGDVLLNVRPVWPIAAVVLLAHLAVGGTVLLGQRFEPAAFMEQLRSNQVAATSLVPTHLARLMDEAAPHEKSLPMLRAIDVGAAAIPVALFERLLVALGPRIGVLYGLTEAPWSCYLPPSSLAHLEGEQRERRMRCVGRPLYGVEVCIRSTNGDPLAVGEEGEITLRGGHLMAGYWNRPEATRQALRDGWFHTGDLGSLDEDGYLSITGRMKELIRTGGKSVLPAEIEEVLMRHPQVDDAVAVGLPDEEWGEVVAAVVVLRPGCGSHDRAEEALIDWCRQQLSSFKKPRRIFFVDQIPRSHYGKPLRARLRDQIRL